MLIITSANHHLLMDGERAQQGIIDKYIGDAVMAYWGPPFIDESDEARLACLAAVEMVERIASLRKELPELLGVRTIPTDCDLRIGIATGKPSSAASVPNS